MRVHAELLAEVSVLDELGREISQFIQTAGPPLGARAQELERAEAPELTGVLKETIARVRQAEPDGYAESIYPQAFYRDFVIGGTGLYGPLKRRIRPKKARALHFFIGGREFFVRSVKGQKPNPFVARAATQLTQQADGILDAGLRGFFA
jgi:hypothetical protein